MSSLRPLWDRIVVKRDEPEEILASGIVMPAAAQEKPKKGVVVAVGTGRLLNNGEVVPLVLKEGDVVLFGAYSGTEVDVDGEKFQIMRESDIVAVVEGEDAVVTTAGDKIPSGDVHPFYQ